YNQKKKRVTKGYGILQPRISVSLPDVTSSRYTRMHGNEPGIDPYTRASSDVYQDLFAEGSFIGKGIYEVDIFQKVLENRFSENRILSHDLLEGCYIRSGLLSDVQLFEKYPTTYRADMTMRLRWIRGDWQIFSWFLPFVPGPGKKWHKNPVSALSRWKIFDNIRRSIVPIALTVLLLLGWMIMPSSLFWTLMVSGIIIFPIFITSVWDTIRKPHDVTLKYHLLNTVQSISEISVKTLFTLICLPFEAFCNLKAILLTLWRMLITKRKLLEWNHSANVRKAAPDGLSACYVAMWIQPVLASVVFILLAIYLPQNLLIADPILLLWFVAPVVAWFASKPLQKQVTILTKEQNIFLQKLARKTWSFFERFVGDQDNWLPPDNFQELPVVQIAHRTSPTNIGLSLLAGLTARDFGYITNRQFIERTSKTIDTMDRMERYKGHFYNWYDTESLTPLPPKYISTVDSGNLAGHLLVLRQGLLQVAHQKIIDAKLFEGLLDTLRVLIDTLEEKNIPQLQPCKLAIETACNDNLHTCDKVKFHIEEINKNYTAVAEKLICDRESETYWWKQKLTTQIQFVNESLTIYTPWLLLKTAPPQYADLVSLNEYSTLAELINTALLLQKAVIQPKTAMTASGETVWLELFQTALTQSVLRAQEQIILAENLARKCAILADMEWDFLYEKSSHLFTIGYNAQEHLADASFYDLLAS
ncbi:MAG TPA: hypothetical protein VKI61_02150, partial [Chitinophagaceae bacterium]|nr:hypothetical protein [Chitinophagaceae bacterium]